MGNRCWNFQELLILGLWRYSGACQTCCHWILKATFSEVNGFFPPSVMSLIDTKCLSTLTLNLLAFKSHIEWCGWYLSSSSHVFHCHKYLSDPYLLTNWISTNWGNTKSIENEAFDAQMEITKGVHHATKGKGGGLCLPRRLETFSSVNCTSLSALLTLPYWIKYKSDVFEECRVNMKNSKKLR